MKKTGPIRIFLDANILFSASYKVDSRFLQFWEVPDATVITSFYAADETRRNCINQSHLRRLEHLLASTFLVANAGGVEYVEHIHLPQKDQPILTAAIAGKSDYLVTSDKAHFGSYYGKQIKTEYGDVTIIAPAVFLDLYFDSPSL